MATRYINRMAGTGVFPALPGAVPFWYDSDDDLIKFLDDDGSTVREVVTGDQAQTLTNKTLTGAIITPKVTEYLVDGAITVESHIAVLTKATAGAYTIAAPTVDGTEIQITSATSAAHVITGTNLFWAGETGGPFNKVTLAAFIGSSARLVAHDGLWLVVSDQIATVGD